jgi:hypothetical protein
MKSSGFFAFFCLFKILRRYSRWTGCGSAVSRAIDTSGRQAPTFLRLLILSSVIQLNPLIILTVVDIAGKRVMLLALSHRPLYYYV